MVRRPREHQAVGLCRLRRVADAAEVCGRSGPDLAVCPTDILPLGLSQPTVDARQTLTQGAPDWLPWVLFLWTLPFFWVATSMSVRRAADAGASPWLGLLILVPLINLPFMLTMCMSPSRPERKLWSPRHEQARTTDHTKSAALAAGAGLLVGGLMTACSVYLFKNYGASLFLGTPLLMSATAAYLDNRRYPRGYGSAILLGMATVSCSGVALLLFALEGAICLVMAAPLLLPIGAAGGVLGKAIADATRRPQAELLAAVLLLPLWAGGESLWPRSSEYLVASSTEVDAPPEAVWLHVVDFPELPAQRPWYFRWGISCPERARIEGHGPGAIRYCEFTTGAFVEPITAWEEPHRLAFNVTEQPAPMFELSFYADVHPPHLSDYLRSTHGEFRLVPLPHGRTRLEGRTWYRLDMYPQWYFTVWSDLLIHRIHERSAGPYQAAFGSQAGGVGCLLNRIAKQGCERDFMFNCVAAFCGLSGASNLRHRIAFSRTSPGRPLTQLRRVSRFSGKRLLIALCDVCPLP